MVNFSRTEEKFWMWLAWHLPARLVYFCLIRGIAHATTNKYSSMVVSELKAMDMVGCWSKDRWGWS